MRLLLIKENPLWKLPERRVARYLKRHLKARNRPEAAEIEADIDEETVYTTVSTMSTNTESNRQTTAPSIVLNNSIPEDEVSNAANNNIEVSIEGTVDIKGESVLPTIGDDTDEPPSVVISGEGDDNAKSDPMSPTNEEEEAALLTIEEDNNSPSEPVADESEAYEEEKDKTDDGPICFGMTCVIS